LVYNPIQSHLRSLFIGITGVAVGTAQVATGQADEDARTAGIRGFPLEAVKDLVDFKGQ
jgi:hypothetical protein